MNTGIHGKKRSPLTTFGFEYLISFELNTAKIFNTGFPKSTKFKSKCDPIGGEMNEICGQLLAGEMGESQQSPS